MRTGKWFALIACLGVLAPAAGLAGFGGPTPLGWWNFVDTVTWTNNHGYAPVSFTNLDTSDFGNPTAVVLDNVSAAWLQYAVTNADGSTNIALSAGSILTWVAPDWGSTNQGGYGPGTWSRLLEVGSYTPDASAGWFSIYTDPAGANLYFSSQDASGCQTNYIAAPIAWTPGRWHHIALTYSTDPASGTALYLDGQWVTNGPPLACIPGADATTNGFFIGSDNAGNNQAYGMFDDFATYAQPLGSNDVSSVFNNLVANYWLNPANPADQMSSDLSSAPPTNNPSGDFFTGQGFLTNAVTASYCTTNSNVWFTNVRATPTNRSFTITFTVQGGSNGVPYDLFATGALLRGSLTNSTWYWLGQCFHCNTYTLLNMPTNEAFLILGTPQDSDGDGVTDAYERLVSHTNPYLFSTDGTGMSDGWELFYFGHIGLNPTSDPDGDGLALVQEFAAGMNPNVPNNYGVSLTDPRPGSILP